MCERGASPFFPSPSEEGEFPFSPPLPVLSLALKLSLSFVSPSTTSSHASLFCLSFACTRARNGEIFSPFSPHSLVRMCMSELVRGRGWRNNLLSCPTLSKRCIFLCLPCLPLSRSLIMENLYHEERCTNIQFIHVII